MYAEKLLPHDVEAEEAIIGSLLLDGDSFLRVSSVIKGEDFYREKNAICFHACEELFRRSEAIDQVTLARELARADGLETVGGMAYLSHLVSITPTYANVVLGYLNPLALAGGTVAIDAARAQAVIETRLAAALRMAPLETAYGVHTVANANMIRAIKGVTTYRGRNPRDFALLAFGGSGGVHAVALARELQTGRVIVPRAAGVFSAVGLLLADLELNLSRAFPCLVAALDQRNAERIYQELEAEIATRIDRDRSATTFRRLADMRYIGQASELTVALPDGALDAAALAELGRGFEREHEVRYGHSFRGEYPLEVVNLRVIGTVVPDGPRRVRRQPAREAAPQATRQVYFGPQFGLVETRVTSRAGLTDAPRPGPVIIEEYEGTVVVPPDCGIYLDGADSIIIDLPPHPGGATEQG